MVIVKFISYPVSNDLDGYLLTTTDLPLEAIPRKGDNVSLRGQDDEILHLEVRYVVWNYTSISLTGDIEVIVEVSHG
jgi:hypothetical protein